MITDEEVCICENCLEEDMEEDLRTIERLKRFGCWAVSDQDGCPIWGEA